MTDSDKSNGKLYEMAVRGTDFREDYEFELYGEEVTAVLRPLVDNEFLPIAAFLADHFELDDEVEDERAVSEALDEVDEAKEEASIEDIEGVGSAMAAALAEAGYGELRDLATADAEELAEIDNIGESLAGRIIEDATELAGAGGVDVTQLDEEFVAVMQEAARMGLHGERDEDGSVIEYDDEDREFVIDNMMGGYSIEIAGEVLEMSGDVRDAERFRGTRGSVDSARNS
jgi:NAD-dependent DNA ligase